MVKTCVECQQVLLEKCRDVLSFVSYAEICNTLVKQMIPRTNNNSKVLRSKCKELVMFMWNLHHNEGFLSMIVWDNINNNKDEFSSGRLNMLELKVKKLCVDLKSDCLSKEIHDDQITDYEQRKLNSPVMRNLGTN